MTMKFGGKPTMKDKAKTVEGRYGKTTGASKGSKPAPKPKVRPILGKDKIGAKITKRF